MDLIGIIMGFGFLATVLGSAIRIFGEHERGVIYRLGQYSGIKGPGLVILVPFLDKVQRKVDMRVITMDVPPQDVITKDNVSVKVNAVIYFKVLEPKKAVVDVEDYYFATIQLAQTTLRSVVGTLELDELLAKREEVNHKVQDILDRHTDPWGIKINMVELKDLDLPKEMQKAMARQAEAERERRAKIISADGEMQAAGKLAQASVEMEKSSNAITLRYLQTLTEITNSNKSHTIAFPIPVEIFDILKKK